MKDDELVYVTGHRHPDTDSIAAAISYAFFKKTMGIKAVPCRLGELNSETKYLLDRFGFEEPMLLEDARKTLGEIKLDEPHYVHRDATIWEVLELMREEKHPFYGIVNDDDTLFGMVTKSDLSQISMGDTAIGIELLKKTPVANFAKTVSGRVIYDDPEKHLNGKVSIIALTKHGVDDFEIKDRIVIVGDDPGAMKKLIERGAGCLIAVWTESISEDVLEAAKEHHCPVIISGHGSMNTSRYVYFAPPVEMLANTNLITFRENELAEDVGRKLTSVRYRTFPVVDENKHLIGYVDRFHLMNYKNKKIILVDHNEFSQSVKSIEKAQLLEVIDHHRIADFATNQPVNFRSEIIGSTATIVSKMFRENSIVVPKNMAGLLLGAILSDTLMFQSPTTTQVDIHEADILAAYAGLDIDTFGKEMFSASANIKDKKIADLINQDVKFFEIKDIKTMISQVIIPETSAFSGREYEIQQELDAFTKKKGLDLCVLALTGIIDKGSIFYISGDKAKWMEDSFEGGPLTLQEGILSRKKQIVPLVTDAINKFA